MNEWWKRLGKGQGKARILVKKGELRKAMRAKCIECCAGQEGEVRECPVADCTLFPFRRGATANEPGNRAMKGVIWRAIREKCMNCSSYSWSEVARCKAKDCALYPHRFGKPLGKVTEKDIVIETDIDETEDETEG